MLAHLRRSDGSRQSLKTHCENVSLLCQRFAQPIGLSQTAKLLGLLHDMGKATKQFKAYLLSSFSEKCSSPHHHAVTGAIFVYRRWFVNGDAAARTTAQLLSSCILGHHAGLCDVLDNLGQSPYLDKMKEPEPDTHYDEAVHWFLEHIASEVELDALFSAASLEISKHFPNPQNPSSSIQASLGLTCRLLLSILVDADRWDSACFEYGDSLSEPPPADWHTLLNTFENYRQTYLNGEGELNRIRAEISDICYQKAASTSGLVTLSVPTGGGKTLSSLRYALRHAAIHEQMRIFYIIPYNTILDQNAKDIREALSNYPSILEHHSNVVIEPQNDESEDDALKSYKRLTERWDSDIILTSLVQFLNACYAAPNTDARRFHRLMNAVLIFDEIQSLPKHCQKLFERAVEFLVHFCHCTVVLCTATQPTLRFSPAPVELMPNVNELYEKFKRVRYIPQMDSHRTYASAASQIAQILESRSVLAIVNTKNAAKSLYCETTDQLKENGFDFVSFDASLPETVLLDAAYASPKEHILCIHLSTLLCPAHRKKLIAWIKAWLKAGRRVLCVSTALIEAGINVSFPVVIRSLTGLPSIVQAAGRANRNMECDEGEVYIWDFYEENLSRLPDIQSSSNIMRSLLLEPDFSTRLDSPLSLERYLSHEEKLYQAREHKHDRDFPIKNPKATLSALFANNAVFLSHAEKTVSQQLILHQSFRTACQHFEVISKNTKSILVPFMEGENIIAALNGKHDIHEEILLLRKAQAYSVSLYEQTFSRLSQNNALYPVGENEVIALENGYYSNEYGIQIHPDELDAIIF